MEHKQRCTAWVSNFWHRTVSNAKHSQPYTYSHTDLPRFPPRRRHRIVRIDLARLPRLRTRLADDSRRGRSDSQYGGFGFLDASARAGDIAADPGPVSRRTRLDDLRTTTRAVARFPAATVAEHHDMARRCVPRGPSGTPSGAKARPTEASLCPSGVPAIDTQDMNHRRRQRGTKCVDPPRYGFQLAKSVGSSVGRAG